MKQILPVLRKERDRLQTQVHSLDQVIETLTELSKTTTLVLDDLVTEQTEAPTKSYHKRHAVTLTCSCGRRFKAYRRDAKYCTRACRNAAHSRTRGALAPTSSARKRLWDVALIHVKSRGLPLPTDKSAQDSLGRTYMIKCHPGNHLFFGPARARACRIHTDIVVDTKTGGKTQRPSTKGTTILPGDALSQR
jgi:hypothetical protein